MGNGSSARNPDGSYSPMGSQSNLLTNRNGPEADPRASRIDLLTARTLGYKAPGPNQRVFPFALSCCAFIALFSLLVATLGSLQVTNIQATIPDTLQGFVTVGTNLGPKVATVLTGGTVALSGELAKSAAALENLTQTLPDEADKVVNVELSVIGETQSAWGIQLAFGKISRLHQPGDETLTDLHAVANHTRDFLGQKWGRYDQELVPLLAGLEETLYGLSAGAEMTRQLLLPFSNGVPAVLKQMDKLTGKLGPHGLEAEWNKQTSAFKAFATESGPAFETAAMKSADVIDAMKSLNRQLGSGSEQLKQLLEGYKTAWQGLKTTIDDFRESAEGHARKHKRADDEDTDPAEANLRALVGQTTRRFVDMEKHAQGAKDVINRMQREVTLFPGQIQVQLDKLSPILNEQRSEFMELKSLIDPDLGSIHTKMVMGYTLAICAVLFTFLFGLRLHTWDPILKEDKYHQKNYLQGICSFQKEHPDFDGSIGQMILGPITRCCFRLRYVCGFHALTGFFVGILGICLVATTLGIISALAWAWLQIMTVYPLDAMCRTNELELLTNNPNCTNVLRTAEAVVNATVLVPGQTCADSHLLVCAQLVQPLMTALLNPGIALAVALVSTACLWPLLDRQLSASFEDLLANVASRVAV